MVLERHRGRPQLTRCLSPEFQAGSPKATVQASGFTRILELGGGFSAGGALRTSSYALVAEVRLRVLGGTVLSLYVFLDFCGGDTSKL